MILSASFYEASDHRIDGPAIMEMAKEIFAKYRFVRHFINVNLRRLSNRDSMSLTVPP